VNEGRENTRNKNKAGYLYQLAVDLKYGYYASMSAIEVIIARRDPAAKQHIGKKLSFDEACEVVFRENRELLGSLAK
jgi:hypothetical protein